jgi:hypothetical protein
MDRVLNLPMCPELGLDILVPEQPHFRGQVPPVSTKQTTVEMNWREERHGARGQALSRGHC